MTGSRAAALLVAIGVAALGLYGLWFHAALPRRLPSDADWRAAASLLAREARPGDAIALAPWWAERGREVLASSLPVLAYPRFAGEDLVGVRRVWLVSLPRAPGHRRDAEGDLAARATAGGAPQRLGALEVTRFDLAAPVLPLAFLPDQLASAEVSVGGRPCAVSAAGEHRCAADGAEVARAVREVDLLPRACLVARPPARRGAPLTVTFREVRLAHSLRGHAGVIGEAALAGRGPIAVAVKIGGREAASVKLAPGDAGWRPFQVDTGADAGAARDVAIAVAAVQGDARPVCLDAYTLP